MSSHTLALGTSKAAEVRLASLFRRAVLLTRLVIERRLELGPATRDELRRLAILELRQLHPGLVIRKIGRVIALGIRRQLARLLGGMVDVDYAVGMVVAAWEIQVTESLTALLVGRGSRFDAGGRRSPLSLLDLAEGASRGAEAVKSFARSTVRLVRRAVSSARSSALHLGARSNEAIQRAVGVGSYRWRTRGDSRVRDSHAALEGRVFSWDDPPPGGPPGTEHGCRCVAIPVRS